ncbi:hypothetical protein [Pseudoalteromonas sp. MEBiC 03485]|uniref:hypothetical protein n=1 Tax=Pseudoalteromonas sp. MEBiC 03485 TaxID=2571103 RepID=UPI00102201CD|nr:hypothetical protein [Pseudoalteromonas sp. MEBiC 03485]RZD20793.1 hypothetical protein EVU92_01450 [Pseudoalteromonas sp. MEBiC 03485]
MEEIVIVGGGLAGSIAALKLKEFGFDPVIIDKPLPQSNGSIGGFTKFSGAKFSLPPAGLGLLKVAKDESEIWDSISEVAKYLNLEFNNSSSSEDTSMDMGTLREYDSLVLSPNEIEDLLHDLEKLLFKENIRVIKGDCTKIVSQDSLYNIHYSLGQSDELILCRNVFYAGGRLGSDILSLSGAKHTSIKGLDLGVRIEFKDINGLKKLRQLGPDAKIIHNDCRTFCLNVPGAIYRYPYMDTSIPGGIITTDDTTGANVGILCRLSDKASSLEIINENLQSVSSSEIEESYHAKGSMLGSSESIIERIYGSQVRDKLNQFGQYLFDEGLVDWNEEHYVHLPLIDWHWNTYSLPGTFKTSLNAVYCLGDSSGHARGLLQAAISGILATREFIDEQQS